MYKKTMKSWMKHIDFILLDVIILELSFFLGYLLRLEGMNNFPDYFYVAWAVLGLLDLLVALFLNNYSGILRRGPFAELLAVVHHFALVYILFLVWLFAVQQTSAISRIAYIFSVILTICFSYLGRLLLKKSVNNYLKKVYKENKTLVFCEEKYKEGICKQLTDAKMGIEPSRVITNEDNFLPFIDEHVVDEVYINLIDREKEKKYIEILLNRGITVNQIIRNNIFTANHSMVRNINNLVVVTNYIKLVNPGELFVKKVMDLLLSLIGVFFMGIAVIIFGPIIYLQSPGSIFFAQTRIGKNGRRFQVFKFRTMYPDAEERKKELMKYNKRDKNMFKMDNDPRIIPIGHFLRKSHIDELPQFVNVLFGDMSIVGTRPPTEAEYKEYDNNHKKRLAIKPGLTGIWQTSKNKDDVDFDEIVTMDVEYITSWSLALDLKLILKTIGVVFTGKD
ncbi:MAG TPA: exopolysaccharide biosynthesis polyprenyl glycosylphosphotransferase [Candidatus Dorea intestinavium]|nr:exopolysaccharide biosynthesis polyprenyl glycosylphosphotransferase [Candidatus Dorea intestinavium]